LLKQARNVQRPSRRRRLPHGYAHNGLRLATSTLSGGFRKKRSRYCLLTRRKFEVSVWGSASDPGITHEVDPDFLEHLRREAIDQPLTRDAVLPFLNEKRSSRVKGQPELPWET